MSDNLMGCQRCYKTVDCDEHDMVFGEGQFNDCYFCSKTCRDEFIAEVTFVDDGE